jgi:hypothetical protein
MSFYKIEFDFGGRNARKRAQDAENRAPKADLPLAGVEVR